MRVTFYSQRSSEVDMDNVQKHPSSIKSQRKLYFLCRLSVQISSLKPRYRDRSPSPSWKKEIKFVDCKKVTSADAYMC